MEQFIRRSEQLTKLDFYQLRKSQAEEIVQFQDLLKAGDFGTKIKKRKNVRKTMDTHNFAKYFKLIQMKNLQKNILRDYDRKVKNQAIIDSNPVANEALVKHLINQNNLKIDFSEFKNGLGNNKEHLAMTEMVDNYDKGKFNHQKGNKKEINQREIDKFILLNSIDHKLPNCFKRKKNNSVSYQLNYSKSTNILPPTINSEELEGAKTQANSPSHSRLKSYENDLSPRFLGPNSSKLIIRDVRVSSKSHANSPQPNMSCRQSVGCENAITLPAIRSSKLNINFSPELLRSSSNNEVKLHVFQTLGNKMNIIRLEDELDMSYTFTPMATPMASSNAGLTPHIHRKNNFSEGLSYFNREKAQDLKPAAIKCSNQLARLIKNHKGRLSKIYNKVPANEKQQILDLKRKKLLSKVDLILKGCNRLEKESRQLNESVEFYSN